MLIIGERINASRKKINAAIKKKDAKFIQTEAINQVKAGADLIDVNCGTDVKAELGNMEWLVKTVQEVIDQPLVIDSANPEVIEAGLKSHKGQAMVNSITAEESKYKSILPLVKRYNSILIALPITEKGLPNTAKERLENIKQLLDTLKSYAISSDVVYFDPLVRAISTESDQAVEFLEAVRTGKSSLGIKTICGLSNISFGLPDRKSINATFLAMALWAGLDAAIIDPTDSQMMTTLRASEALLGKDEYCMNYITFCRAAK